MILFFSKKTGNIFATIDGRVHDEKHLKCSIDNGIGKKNIGKYIIGWVEKGNKKIKYNLNKFKLLQEFEDITLLSPLDCRINLDTGDLEKKPHKQGSAKNKKNS